MEQMTRNDDQDPLKVPAVANVLDTTSRGVYKMIRDGKLRAARINGRGDIRVYRAWIREAVEKLAANDGR